MNNYQHYQYPLTNWVLLNPPTADQPTTDQLPTNHQGTNPITIFKRLQNSKIFHFTENHYL